MPVITPNSVESSESYPIRRARHARMADARVNEEGAWWFRRRLAEGAKHAKYSS